MIMSPNNGTGYPVRMPPVRQSPPITVPTPTLPPGPTPVARPIRYLGPPDTAPQTTGTTGGAVSDSGSGGTAMSGLDDLFGSIGNAFNNLTHPGADQTTSGASQPTSNSSSIITWAIIALVVYFLFLR